MVSLVLELVLSLVLELGLEMGLESRQELGLAGQEQRSNKKPKSGRGSSRALVKGLIQMSVVLTVLELVQVVVAQMIAT